MAMAMRHPKNRPADMVEEAHEEVREADTPGARGHEYRDRERMGDEGQPYRHGGHAKKRERGGFMPEETERSEPERGKHQRGQHEPHEAEEKPDEKEGTESYEDVHNPDAKKRGGAAKKRAHGGRLDAAKQHAVGKGHPAHHSHHGRKGAGKVPGKMAKGRPDRRARGGATTSDLHPETAAGRMSVPHYEREFELARNKGSGKDTKGIQGGQHHGKHTSRDQ